MRFLRYLLLALLLVFLASLLTGVTQVQRGERAVIRRFGRILEEKPSPGLHLGLPWGIDRVDRVPVDLLVRGVTVGYQPQEGEENQTTIPPGQLITGDNNLVNVRVKVNYNVRENEVERFVLQADRADRLIGRAVETALAEWVACRTVDDVLLHGKAELPTWLIQRTQGIIEPYGLGVQVQTASVAELSPPEEVKAAFDDVTRSEYKKKRVQDDARAEAERQMQTANTEKIRIDNDTAAYKDRTLKEARADAERFEERLRKNQQLLQSNRNLALNSIWWDEMRVLFTRLKENNQIQLLDHFLTRDGLDLTLFAPLPGK